MLGHGFNSEIAQNKTMAAGFDDHLKPQQISSSQSTSSDNSLQKKVIIIPSSLSPISFVFLIRH